MGLAFLRLDTKIISWAVFRAWLRDLAPYPFYGIIDRAAEHVNMSMRLDLSGVDA